MKLKIDDKEIEAKAGATVLEAALQAGIYIPNLCYHPDMPPIGACRLCVVEIEGMRGVPASCTTLAREGMVVRTDTGRLRELRKDLLWLIFSGYPGAPEKGSQLEKVAGWVGSKELLPGFVPRPGNIPPVLDEPFFIRDLDKCILCGRCVRMCREVRKTGAIGLINRGVKTVIGTGAKAPLKDSGCKFCLACVEVCPSGALRDKEKFEEKDRAGKLLPCVNSCPAGIDIPRYVRLIAAGKYQDALEVIREKVPFPLALGYACNHACEEVCRRGQLNEPISIKALKRFVAERDSGRWRSKLVIAPPTGKKAAVVGSGPAGLTAAWYLRLAGHAVTVFETLSEPGGMMRSAIPAYRLPRNILKKEIAEIENIGVKIETGTRIDSLDELFKLGFDAVFVATGAPAGMKMGVEGEADPRVLDGIDFLQAVSFGHKADIAGDVLVVGGGNVAMDVARTAIRTGAKKVTVLYRRTRGEMPALSEEVEEALKEGVKIRFLTAPEKLFPAGKKLGVECVLMELGEPDASGRRRPVPVKGSNIVIKADRLITAIGQSPAVPAGFGLATNKKCCVQADLATMASPRHGVFAGGDAVSGPASIIEAIQAGRKAAAAMDKYLGGTGVIDREFIAPEEPPVCLLRDEKFCSRERAAIPELPAAKRRNKFDLVEHAYKEKTAVEEAGRCLRCELRLRISKVPLPPDPGNQ
jgi:NADPH-dependent glutamate synthase beta subunit-like oxidoreductase